MIKLKFVSQITIPPRPKASKHVYHLYSVIVKDRDNLLNYLIDKGIDAKVHYPIPMHLQPASKEYNYSIGDFPVQVNLPVSQ